VVSVGNDAKAANFPVGVVENGEILPVQFGSPELTATARSRYLLPAVVFKLFSTASMDKAA
jgi:hypothetical protein